MSGFVWVSKAIMDDRSVKKVTADITVNDAARAIEAGRRYAAGQPLSADWFPEEIWADKGSGIRVALPALFYANGYWVVSAECADVLRRFDLGQSALYPVRALQSDRKTPLPGEYLCLSFGNVKWAFLGAESREARQAEWSEELWKLPFVLKDDDLTVSAAALDGPDLWVDPALLTAFFVSDRLARALKAASVSQPFGLRRCRVISLDFS